MRKKTLTSYIRVLKKDGIMEEIIGKKELFSEKISALCADSRRCAEGCIFFCKGALFLPKYLTEALRKGASAIVFEKKELRAEVIKLSEKYPRCFFIAVSDVKKAMASLAAFHYGYPLKKAITIAVTGTKGKTGTVTSINAALGEHAGFKPMILNGALPPKSPHLTTPEPIELHAAAHRCIRHGATHIICEISSQGQKMLRTYGIVFDIALFLNFGADHISPAEHPSLYDYFLCKASLFSVCKRAVINRDSEKWEALLRVAEESRHIISHPETQKKEIYSFSFKDTEADFLAEVTEEGTHGSLLNVSEKSSYNIAPTHSVRLPLLSKSTEQILPSTADVSSLETSKKAVHILKISPLAEKKHTASPLYINTVGFFSAQNALAAYSVCRLLDCTPDEIFRGILTARAPGRMELFDTADGRVRVIVDYAHNEMSFTALFEAAKRMYNGSPPPITAIFGASGNKAYGRRYALPKVALAHADRIIICEEDSGREPFESIRADLLANIQALLLSDSIKTEKAAGISVIRERKRAIRSALFDALENGERRLILFTGKGRENTAFGKNGEIPTLDDVTATRIAIKDYNCRLSLSKLFSSLGERRGEFFTVCLEGHGDITDGFAASALPLLTAGVRLLAVCDEGDADKLSESAFKAGIICDFCRFEKIGEEGTALPLREGAVTVAVARGNIKGIASEISVREKSDALVYLTRGGGIIHGVRPLSPMISERSAAAISERMDSEYLSAALGATRGGVKRVAVIDGRDRYALALYGTGGAYGGTVIYKESY